MSTVTPGASTRRRDRVRVLTGARAVAAAALAAVITFNADHTPVFGLLAYGVFQLVQAAIVALAVQQRTPDADGRVLTWARAVAGVLAGVVALALPYGGLPTLLAVTITGSIVLGSLEFAAGARRVPSGRASSDAMVVGVLTAVMGVLFAVAHDDSVFVVGFLGAWAAIVAVYLGIAAASMGEERR